MSWLTSPAATELEERVCDWIRDAKGINSSWKAASTTRQVPATLSALLTAREKATNYEIYENGFSKREVFRVYSSAHVHSSIDKALKIAGIGAANLVRIAVDKKLCNDS